jgi:hypothetical protein
MLSEFAGANHLAAQERHQTNYCTVQMYTVQLAHLNWKLKSPHVLVLRQLMPRLVVVQAFNAMVFTANRATSSGLKICRKTDSLEPAASLQMNTA